MEIKGEHFLLILIMSFVFLILGMAIGGNAALSSKKEWYQEGQESCKVCEVIKNDTKA